MRRSCLIALLTLIGCNADPDWMDDCGCESGQLCVLNSDAISELCIAVPQVCQGYYANTCPTTELDEGCMEALCGADMPSHIAACESKSDGELYGLMNCAPQPTDL